ncbi:hypothetical protein [Bifidobacterium pseudolongum]|uniref:Right-handed parallel beta-helix repeat-containing protein n=1 Tax=Bifidobacterium pseudolongum subsp. globosum TaxID=1690 RepID=A0A2N3QTL0_9BIFI|nr:hypothetical protein [Bifidobacterium pseudolongum]PKU95361.1 hypothetical protein CQR45_1005 [Bifidobacterium pseudolongum subsp. globosum]PKV00144.1 hypothetical protein CQR54_1015 [Bifidobacterium pseudolongum subsp. globosum]
MTEQIVDIIEANMPASSDVVNVARGAGGEAGRVVAAETATDVATRLTDVALAAKVDRHGVGQVTLDNLSNEVKAAMAGGATLIWDETTNDLNAELAMRPRYGYRPEESLMLFDLDDPHASGVYVNSTSGRVNTAPDNAYRIYVVPVEGHSTLYVNGDANTSLQVSFTSRYNDPTTLANGDHLIGYISGWRANEQTRPQAGHPYEVPVPEGSRYAVCSSNGMGATYLSVVTGINKVRRAWHDPQLAALDESKLDAVRSRNLFDPTNPRYRIDGCYVSQNNGSCVMGADAYMSVVIPVDPGMRLSFSAGFERVCFYRDWVGEVTGLDLQSGSLLSVFVSGTAQGGLQDYEVPAGAHMMIVSIKTANTARAQIEVGSASTPYVSGRPGLSVTDIIDMDRTLTVGPGRMYATISEAVAAASDSDEILVYPGVYDESVHAWGKRVRIRGTSKRDCILTHSALNYADPPLEMSHGELSNLTIRGTNTGTQTGVHHAYCMHVEDGTCNGSSLYVHDVIFENAVHSCVGIGLRNHYALEFRGCEFHATGAANTAVYAHDHETSTHGEDDQHLAIIDCSLETAGGTVIKLQSQEISGNHATLCAQRNIIVNTANPSNLVTMSKWDGRDEGQDGLLGSYAWTLDPTSQLNTADVLNATAA